MNQMDKILQESVDILRQLDRNTERYMVEELRQEKDELQQKKNELQQEKDELQQELLDNARNLFLNKVSFEIVRNSIKALSEETLQEIYDEVMANKTE